MSEKNPVTYAERALGVHDIYAQAVAASDQLDAERVQASDVRAALADLRERVADCEAQIVSDQRATHADLGYQEFNRHLKVVLQQDAEHRELRKKIASLEVALEHRMETARTLSKQLSIYAARMNELAGLLFFYGATTHNRSKLHD